MQKYHINSNQEVKICKADKRKCRFGDDNHSHSPEDLYIMIEKSNEFEYSPVKSLKKGNKKIKTNPGIQNSVSQDEVDKITQNMFEEHEFMKNNISKDEFSALFAYSGNGYAAINETLRGNINKKHKNGIKHKTHYEKADERIELIDNVMSQYGMGENKSEKTLYRFRALDKNQKIEDFIQENFPQDKVIEEKGYMSTSEDLAFILGHTDSSISNSDNQYVIFEINTSKGISLQENPIEKPHKLQSLEKERLLPRNMKFLVDNIEKRNMQIDESRENIKHKYFWDYSRQRTKDMKPREYYVITLKDKDVTKNTIEQ